MNLIEASILGAVIFTAIWVFYTAATAPTMLPDLNGAVWKCSQCYLPGNDSGMCNPMPNINCEYKCSKDNKTYNYKTNCAEQTLVKQLEGLK